MTPATKTYDTEIEKAVLGAIFTSEKVLDRVYETLEQPFFYSEAHQLIYGAIKKLYDENRKIDTLTLTKELRDKSNLEKVGGSAYIVQISQFVFSASHVEAHIEELRNLHVKRTMLSYASDLQNESQKGDKEAKDLIDYAEKTLFEMNDLFVKNSTQSIEDVVEDVFQDIQMAMENGVENKGIRTGFTELDQKLNGGFQPSDLVVVAARPGMGKTALTLTMARNMAVKYGHKVAFFTLEMPPTQLALRLIAAECELPMTKLQKSDFTDDELVKLHISLSKLKSAGIYIDDAPGLSIFELRAKARRMKAMYDIEVIIIDYLQLMSAGSNMKAGNREQEISLISKNLKILAKELDVPVITLAQLNRNVESRGSTLASKRPQLSDLRESGAIEQDADIVSFIFRPEKYIPESEWDDEFGGTTKDQAEFIIGKFRNGEPSITRLGFEGKYVRFKDLQANALNQGATKTVGSSQVYDPSSQSDDGFVPRIDEGDLPY